VSQDHSDQEERDRLVGLTRLVGKYYVEYWDPRSSKQLMDLVLKRGEHEVPYSEVRLWLISAAMKIALSTMIKATREAAQDRLTYREFSVEYESEPLGFIDVARTLQVYPQGICASLNYRPSLDAPEYAAMRFMAESVLDVAKDVREEEDRIKRLLLAPQAPSILELRSELEDELAQLPMATQPVDDKALSSMMSALGNRAPNWLTDAYSSYSLSKLMGNPPHVSSRQKEGNNELTMIGWKLYEMLVAIMAFDLLLEKGYLPVAREQDGYVMEKDGKVINLRFNSSLEGSSLTSYDQVYDRSEISKISGRPDLSILAKDKIIFFECKFSTDPSYITSGRFKVMAYLLEYGGSTGVLVFPGLKGSSEDYDEEDHGTRKLYEKMIDGMVEVRFSSKEGGKNLYLLKLDPLDPEEQIKSKLRNLLRALENV